MCSYYVQRRDPEFELKMVTVLHVYKEVEIVNAGLAEGTVKKPAVVTISFQFTRPAKLILATDPEGLMYANFRN